MSRERSIYIVLYCRDLNLNDIVSIFKTIIKREREIYLFNEEICKMVMIRWGREYRHCCWLDIVCACLWLSGRYYPARLVARWRHLLSSNLATSLSHGPSSYSGRVRYILKAYPGIRIFTYSYFLWF